jgi:hypothetical protein
MIYNQLKALIFAGCLVFTGLAGECKLGTFSGECKARGACLTEKGFPLALDSENGAPKVEVEVAKCTGTDECCIPYKEDDSPFNDLCGAVVPIPKIEGATVNFVGVCAAECAEGWKPFDPMPFKASNAAPKLKACTTKCCIPPGLMTAIEAKGFKDELDEELALEKNGEFLKDVEFNEKELEEQQQLAATETPKGKEEIADTDAAALGGFIDISKHPLLSKRLQRQKTATVMNKRTSSFLQAAEQVRAKACLKNSYRCDFKQEPLTCGGAPVAPALLEANPALDNFKCCTGGAVATCPGTAVPGDEHAVAGGTSICCLVNACPPPFVQVAGTTHCKQVCMAPNQIPCLRNRLCTGSNRECYNLKKKLILTCGLAVLGIIGIIVGAVLTAGAAAVIAIPVVAGIVGSVGTVGATIIAVLGITDQAVCDHAAPPNYFKFLEHCFLKTPRINDF